MSGPARFMDDTDGMKPIAVQFPPPLSVAPAEWTRASARYAPAAYLTSLALAGVTLVGSVFHREISGTFGSHVLGLRTAMLWEGAVAVVALGWFAATILGLLCLPLGGRPRAFGMSSVGMNLAAALLVASTVM